MALHADTIWGVISTASNGSGGGWHDLGGASVDYSEQDAPELSVGDAVADGSTTITSVTGGFTAAMAGSTVNIVTKGRFEIAVVTDGNTITIDRNCSAGTGLTANVGGAVADLEEIDSLLVPGNTVHMKAGTYNLAAALVTAVGGNTTGRIRIFGYKTTRGDKPAEADMPLIAGGAHAITINQFNLVKYVNFTTTHISGVNLSSQASAEKCKSHNTSGSANYQAFKLSVASELISCTGISDNGYAVNVAAADAVILHNRLHSSVRGINTGVNCNTVMIVGNIIRECTAYGIILGSNASQGLIMDNTIDDCVIGIYCNNAHNITIRNNSISHNSEEGMKSLANVYGVRLNYNNFHDNTPDVTNLTKGDETMAYDPEYTGEDNYKLQPGSDLIGAGEVIELDVG